MESGAAHRAASPDLGDKAGVAAAVASVAGFVGELTRIVVGSPDAAPVDAVPAADADPLQEFADDCLDGLALVRKIEAATAALKVRLVDGHVKATAAMEDPASRPEWVSGREMAMVAEVACVLTIGERAAGALIGEAHALTSSLPAALGALQSGEVPWQNARVLVDETTGLDPAATAALERHFLNDAPGAGPGGIAGVLPPARLRRKVRSWREHHHPDSIEKRHLKRVTDRRMEYAPDRDAMAWVSMYLTADQANAAWNRTRALARGLQGPDERRTLPQLMADVPRQPSSPAEPVPLLPSHRRRGRRCWSQCPCSLLGFTEEPAMLDGHGPIPASMARRLVADGAESFHRVLVDPWDGVPLEIGRTSYRVTKAMRNWLRLRDGKCPFPGCSSHSLDNEADHLLAWAKGGTTGISNLGQPCPKHHRLRHTSGWKPTPATKNEPPGWISPTRRRYKSEHQDWEPPLWQPGILSSKTSLLEEALRERLSA